jgi:DNA repair exonuclease SbcCD ATPase subunit
LAVKRTRESAEARQARATAIEELDFARQDWLDARKSADEQLAISSKTHEEKITSQELLKATQDRFKAVQQQRDGMGNMCNRAITQSQDAHKATEHFKEELDKSERAATLLKTELDQVNAAFGDCGNLESRLNRLRHYKKEADKAVKHREELESLTTKVSKLKSEISQLQDALKKSEGNWAKQSS